MFFEVIPTEVFRENGGILTYQSDQKLLPGQLVLIPLGRRTIIGIVLKKVSRVDFPTKPIIRLIHPTPIPNHLLKSILWLSKYYLSPLPNVANLCIPAGLIGKNLLKKALTEPSSANSLLEASIPTTGELSVGNIPLSPAQQKALEALYQAPGVTRLLRGVTGSGKTNIYLKMAANALKEQKSTILLVPEIALTSQLVQIFSQTFSSRVILLHSGQTPAERRRLWLQVLENTAPVIIIGPRSALFAPIHNLGLIIIDEAHEGAYYQENAPRYSALRLASFIAKSEDIPCIEGTATPNITDYYLAKNCHTLVELAEKAKSTAIAPEITIIDLKDRQNFTHNRYFSDSLLTAIKNNLQTDHQTLIFHNRRGSAPLTLCEDCGWQALCPECYLPMTLHADSYTLNCHICGHEEKVPTGCPECHKPGIIHKGFGTKLLETELQRLFPEARIARFDGDNNKSANLSQLYNEVKSGAVQILLGTQTLARGLDLPHLATVGVVQADAGLSLPDFAAEERTFELLNQVAGRVGRGHLDRAEVIVQTYQPNHPAIQTALNSDYHEFANYLLTKRHQGQLPPFTYLARLAITYKTEKTTLAKIRHAHTILNQSPHIHVSPPLPAFHERTTRGYTWQLTLKSTSRSALVKALLPFAKFHIELDPPSLL